MNLNRYGYNDDALQLLKLAFFEFQELYSETGNADHLHLLAATSARRAQVYLDIDNDAEARVILSGTAEAMGDVEAARTTLKRALDRMVATAPGSVELIELRQRVEKALAEAERP